MAEALHYKNGKDRTGVFMQFEDIDQQNESYVVGMWTFLVTEVMFFGALFFAYILYRWKFQADFYQVHKLLDVRMGTINTVILLTSSLSTALAVRSAMLKKHSAQIGYLLFTIGCAFGFLIIKYFEYSAKISHHLFPNAGFQWHHPEATFASAKMFFNLYFAMTGLHGIHVVLGIIAMSVLILLTVIKSPLVEDYIPTELVGLYWHFVDLVWIFLFPLFYLMPK